MKPYKLIAEHDDHFVVHDGTDAKPFKVAKTRLAHGTVERIRQHFADGGEVQPDEYDPSTGAPITPYTAEQRAELVASAPLGMLRGFGLETPPSPAPTASPTATPETSTPAPPQDTAPMGTPPPPGPTGAPGAALFPTLAPDRTAQQIAQATTAESAALGQKGAAEASGFANMAKIQQAQNEQAAQSLQDSEAQFQQRMARQEQLYNQASSGQIDPNHYWATQSTGQKIGASIGIILSGIGSGLTGQPNLAMQVISKAIDRDVEAQRFNLSKKVGLLHDYMQQTQDIVAAQHKFRADAYTLTAGKIAAAAAQTNSATAVPNAQATIAALRAKGAQEEQLAQERAMQMKQQQLSLNAGQFQMQAMQEFLRGGSSGGGTRMDPRAFALLPKELQEKIVPLGDGSYATARTKEDAAIVTKTQEQTALLREKLKRYGSLLAEHPNGVSQALAPNDYARAQAIHDSIITDINSLAGLNRFTHEEAEIFGGRVPDITTKQVSRGHQAKLDELGKEIDDKTWSTNQTYLNIQRGRRPGG